MTVYGLSQSSGVERRLVLRTAGQDVSLAIYELKQDVECDSISVQSAALLSAIIDQPEGGLTIQGTHPDAGAPRGLDVEVRRNEVQLRSRGGAGGDCDIAVGLDDLQDALEGVIG